MNKRELEALGKRLLPELPGFAVKGQLLFMRPVGHTLRGVFLDRTSNPKKFNVQVFLKPLYVPSRNIGFNVGWRIRHSDGSWKADNPNLISELVVALKREALPFLSRVESHRDMAGAAASLKKSYDAYVQQAIAYAFARAGDVELACDSLDKLIGFLGEEVPWQKEMTERARSLKAQLAVDPVAAQKQLDAWESETAINLGIEKFI